MIDFLNLNFWFTLNPGPWYQSGTVVLWGGIGMLILALLFKLAVKFFKIKGVLAKFWNKLATWALVLGLLDLVLWFFRDQRVPFFSSRFWLLIVVLLALVWLIFIFIFLIKKKPEEKKGAARAQEFDKYLPSRNR